MANKSHLFRIVFLVGVLLLGALLIYTYGLPSSSKQESAVIGQKAVIKTQIPSAPSVVPGLAPGPSITTTPSTLSPEDQKKWGVLREIINSKNDNDPRMDKDLKNLSPAFHAEIYKEYQHLPMEKRNERGLLAFLIARDLKDPQDFEFLKSIYQESPCLSLGDCSTRSQSDPHLAGIDQISTNYPQLSALQQLKQQAKNKHSDDPNYRDQMKALLSQAAQFPVPIVQKKAEEVLSQIP